MQRRHAKTSSSKAARSQRTGAAERRVADRDQGHAADGRAAARRRPCSHALQTLPGRRAAARRLLSPSIEIALARRQRGLATNDGSRPRAAGSQPAASPAVWPARRQRRRAASRAELAAPAVALSTRWERLPRPSGRWCNRIRSAGARLKRTSAVRRGGTAHGAEAAQRSGEWSRGLATQRGDVAAPSSSPTTPESACLQPGMRRARPAPRRLLVLSTRGRDVS